MTETVDAIDRIRLGPIENPVRGALHGSAAAVACSLTGWLWSTDTPPPYPIAFSAFAATQALLYSTSALYHALPWRPARKALMQRLDHAMIYLAIAGTLTAIVLLGLDGLGRALLLVATWVAAIAGMVHELRTPGRDRAWSTPIKFSLALLALPALPGFFARFPGTPTALLVLGAAAFAVGAACFATRSPRLWPRVFSFHEVFHVCTVVGSGAHYMLFVRYLWQVG